MTPDSLLYHFYSWQALSSTNIWVKPIAIFIMDPENWTTT
jgi:hypothetical protein